MKLFLSIFVLMTSFSIWEHSEGTDSSGCHTNHSTGNYHCNNPKRVSERAPSSADYRVMYNEKSKKYHQPHCKSALACTVKCVPLTRTEAVSRGGVPCGNCGG